MINNFKQKKTTYSHSQGLQLEMV